MPKLREAMQFAKMNIDDRTSAPRFKEILSILKKHEARKDLTPDKAVAILEDLGSTFVKLGQIASTHPDVLPQNYCDAFAKLRANVSPLSYEEVMKQIESELGSDPSKVFRRINKNPLGSASIAQVHKAVLRHGGNVVAVKVQRPGIVEKVAEDLTLMRHLLLTYEFFDPEPGNISFEQLLDELERSSNEELDFTLEAGNIIRFGANNEGREGIRFPRAYPEYSTSALLVMDFAEGTRVGDAEGLAALEVDEDEMAQLIASNYVSQMLEDGFFHADPHAGNIIVSKEGIEWIDFGMMGTLDARERETLKRMMLAVGKKDAYGLKTAMTGFMHSSTGNVDHARLLEQCDTLITQYCSVDLGSFNTGSLLQDLILGMGEQGCSFTPSVMMLGRGLVTLEGTIRMLSKKVSVLSVVTEYLQSSFDPASIKDKAREVMAAGVDSAVAMSQIPSKVNETLDMAQKGQLSVGAKLQVGEEFIRIMRSAFNHFTLALIAAALFMGSCILCTTQLQPIVLGVPLLGLVGFACGLAIALGVFISMHRADK